MFMHDIKIAFLPKTVYILCCKYSMFITFYFEVGTKLWDDHKAILNPAKNSG